MFTGEQSHQVPEKPFTIRVIQEAQSYLLKLTSVSYIPEDCLKLTGQRRGGFDPLHGLSPLGVRVL